MCFQTIPRGAARPSGAHGELWLCALAALVFLGLILCLYVAEQRHRDEVQARNLAHSRSLKCPLKTN
jgi:uncharacterized membrane protein (DUF4010 family)